MKNSKVFYLIIGLTGIGTILVGMQIQDYITTKNHLWEDSVVLYLMIPAVILCFFAIGLIHREFMNKKQKVGSVE